MNEIEIKINECDNLREMRDEVRRCWCRREGKGGVALCCLGTSSLIESVSFATGTAELVTAPVFDPSGVASGKASL